MVAFLGLLQLELRAAADHYLAVFDEQDQAPLKRQHLRLTIHQSQHDGVERRPQSRVAHQVVHHHVGLGIAAQFYDDSHAVAV